MHLSIARGLLMQRRVSAVARNNTTHKKKILFSRKNSLAPSFFPLRFQHLCYSTPSISATSTSSTSSPSSSIHNLSSETIAFLNKAKQNEPREDTPEEWQRYRYQLNKMFGPEIATLMCSKLQIDRSLAAGVVPDIQLWNEHLYARSCLDHGIKDYFRTTLKSHVTPNRETYQILISGTVTSSSFEDCWESFQEMKKEGFKPDIYTLSRLVDACGYHGHPEFLAHILEEFNDLGEPPLAEFYGNVAESYMRWGCVEPAFDALDLIKKKGLQFTYGICGRVYLVWLKEHIPDLPPRFIPLLARFKKMEKEVNRQLEPEDEKDFQEFVKWARNRDGTARDFR